MAKKTTKVTETVEETAPDKKDEETTEKAIDAPILDKNAPDKKQEETKNETKVEETKVETKPAPPVVDDDDDISFIKQTLAKQMIDSLDIDTLKKFVVECEGKSLKYKAQWIEKNKTIPAPDPSKGLAKGPPNGKPLSPYDPGYKHVFIDNRVK